MMKKEHHIQLNGLNIADIPSILQGRIVLSDEVKQKVSDTRAYLDELMVKHEDPIYGINTGFGSLCNTKIDKAHLNQLQENLIMSHACGMGEEVPGEVVKLMLLLKIQGLSFGHSGVSLETLTLLTEFYNRDILPVVYQLGSLGASGDLAPLLHAIIKEGA